MTTQDIKDLQDQTDKNISEICKNQKDPDLSITDLSLWLHECFKDVENINIDFRVIKKYIEDFYLNNKIKKLNI